MRVLAVADGPVAVSWCVDSEEQFDDDFFRLRISNPFLKASRILETPSIRRIRDYKLPTLAVATDRLSRRLRVFLMDNAFGYTPFLWIHESDGWHPARHPPNPQCDDATNPSPNPTPEKNEITTAWSAVVFRDDLHAILSPRDSEVCFLMKYDYEKDTWTAICDDALDSSAQPQLLVSGDRLFMRFWRSGTTLDSCLLEIIEIVENAFRMVLQVPSATLERFFGEPSYFVEDVACVVPRGMRSDGSCRAVALVSRSSGRVVVYDVVSGFADVLPVHPLEEAQPLNPRMRYWYWATNTKLSCRDFLLPIRPWSQEFLEFQD